MTSHEYVLCMLCRIDQRVIDTVEISVGVPTPAVVCVDCLMDVAELFEVSRDQREAIAARLSR